MILTVKDIVSSLNQRAEEYARFLLPNGKRVGAEWEVGSVGGESGSSLRVRLNGDKAGRWADFAGDDRGDLIGLTIAVKRVGIGEAIRIAKEWLGIRDPESAVPGKSYRKPTPKGVKKLDMASAVSRYLTEKRKLQVDTQTAFRIAQSTGMNGPEIAFPYFSPDGQLVNVKRLALQRSESGKKFMAQESGCAPSLFGWQALDSATREVIITEGELDAMTWHQNGFSALSVPDGAEGSTWLDVEWENLQRFDRIWLNWDGDPAGQKAVKGFARKLGYGRCFILSLPGHKDANEALMSGETSDYFAKAVAAAKPIAPEQIKEPSAFKERVIEKFYPSDLKAIGFHSRLFADKLGMRPGEVTIWTGVSGHGKSVLLSQLMLESLFDGNKVALGSFEMLPEQTLHRMLCQSEATNRVPQDRIGPILDWLRGRIWIYDLLGNISPKLILDLLEYSFVRHGVNLFVIDSLMKCSLASDDYDAQRVFLNDLCGFAKDTRTHINLVAHARKGNDESDAPGKLDVKGSSDIINQADNILCVWRNKEKEQAGYNGQKSDAPDAIVYCSKQRETGDEFMERFLFKKGCFIFMRQKDEKRPDLSIWKELNPPPESSDAPAQDSGVDDPHYHNGNYV